MSRQRGVGLEITLLGNMITLDNAGGFWYYADQETS